MATLLIRSVVTDSSILESVASRGRIAIVRQVTCSHCWFRDNLVMMPTRKNGLGTRVILLPTTVFGVLDPLSKRGLRSAAAFGAVFLCLRSGTEPRFVHEQVS